VHIQEAHLLGAHVTLGSLLCAQEKGFTCALSSTHVPRHAITRPCPVVAQTRSDLRAHPEQAAGAVLDGLGPPQQVCVEQNVGRRHFRPLLSSSWVDYFSR
jgi:hypothetical protein